MSPTVQTHDSGEICLCSSEISKGVGAKLEGSGTSRYERSGSAAGLQKCNR